MRRRKRKYLFRKSIPNKELYALMHKDYYEWSVEYKDLIKIKLIRTESHVEVITSSKLPIKCFMGACRVNASDIRDMYTSARDLMVRGHWGYIHGNQIQSRR